MTARGMGLRICWDCHRGCCEAGPPPSMPRCRVSIHENLERILWLRKRRRRKRPRRRRPRSRRRSEFWPGWSAQLRPGSQLRVQFGEWRALGSAFLIPAARPPMRLDMDCFRLRQGFGGQVGPPAMTADQPPSAPQTRAWRRARQIPPQNSGAARPSPSGG
jgi:hypothetical protein